MLKKSYKGFVIWMIAFCALVTASCFLPFDDVGLLVRIVDILCIIGIEGLMLLIYKTENIFWINSISFEAAVEAGSDRRKAYALKYVKLFGIFTLVCILLSLVLQLLHVTYWVDFAVVMVGMIGCAFYSIKFKL